MIPLNHEERMDYIVDTAWLIFISRFIGKRHPIGIEAPFQHHFANVLLSVGELCCLSREDMFFVDLEKRCEGIKGKNKYIDIVCSFDNVGVSCAIELKFKPRRHAAQDLGRIDAYIDIEAVELACQKEFTIGRFFMITDDHIYTQPSTRGVGTVFALHDGHEIQPGRDFEFANATARNAIVRFANRYTVNWEKAEDWYFLQVKVPRATNPQHP